MSDTDPGAGNAVRNRIVKPASQEAHFVVYVWNLIGQLWTAFKRTQQSWWSSSSDKAPA
jgi:hypothetical protein